MLYTERMKLNKDGRLSLGTPNSLRPLEVAGDAANYHTAAFTSATGDKYGVALGNWNNQPFGDIQAFKKDSVDVDLVLNQLGGRVGIGQAPSSLSILDIKEGNVLVGTNAPGLSYNGWGIVPTIASSSVTVAGNVVSQRLYLDHTQVPDKYAGDFIYFRLPETYPAESTHVNMGGTWSENMANLVCGRQGDENCTGFYTWAEPDRLGDLRAATVFYNSLDGSSDQRWKKNIADLDNSLKKVLNLQGVSFEFDREKYPQAGFPEGRNIGFIGQEVEKVVPEVVNTDADGYKYVSYPNMTALLVEAIKEQQREIEKLKEELARLK
jgi:hypothetical protein